MEPGQIIRHSLTVTSCQRINSIRSLTALGQINQTPASRPFLASGPVPLYTGVIEICLDQRPTYVKAKLQIACSSRQFFKFRIEVQSSDFDFETLALLGIRPPRTCWSKVGP